VQFSIELTIFFDQMKFDKTPPILPPPREQKANLRVVAVFPLKVLSAKIINYGALEEDVDFVVCSCSSASASMGNFCESQRERISSCCCVKLKCSSTLLHT
jgi:hypothetical protein